RFAPFTALPILKKSERCLLYSRLLVLPVLIVSSLVSAAGSTTVPEPESRLRLFHTHTGEHLDLVYRRGGAYVAGALEKLDEFLRDHRTGGVHHYDPRIFDLLSELAAKIGRANAEISVVCGYRSSSSNEYL